ncbi:MAG: caspase domain-containing protein [Pseudorhodoplanes sp.]
MKQRFAIAVLLLLFGLSAQAAAQDRVALVVGNGKYAHAGPLPNPANDARAVAVSLRELGFEVLEGADLDRSGMERLIRDFLRKISKAKIALLFYAGHGMQIDGRNYLVPVDAKLESATDLSFETIELDRLLDSLSDPARATIVMLDACRDNPLSRSFASKARSAAVGSGLAAYANPGTGTLIAFATAPGKVALDGQSSNSPFTEGLVKHLRTPGLEVRQLLTRVRKDVSDATRGQQIPWDNSSLLGDVYLASLPVARPSVPPAPPALQEPAKPAALPPPSLKPSGRTISFQGGGVFGIITNPAGGDWVESNSSIGQRRFVFKTVSEKGSELILHDASRDFYLRLNFDDRQLQLRVGANGQWTPLYQIAGIYNPDIRATRRIAFSGRGIVGVFSGDAGGKWIENNSSIGVSEFQFRTLSENQNELIVFDPSRDYYIRFDFKERKILLRQTQRGQWGVLYDIMSVIN